MSAVMSYDQKVEANVQRFVTQRLCGDTVRHSLSYMGWPVITVSVPAFEPLYKQQEQVLRKAYQELQFTVFQGMSYQQVESDYIKGVVDITVL